MVKLSPFFLARKAAHARVNTNTETEARAIRYSTQDLLDEMGYSLELGIRAGDLGPEVIEAGVDQSYGIHAGMVLPLMTMERGGRHDGKHSSFMTLSEAARNLALQPVL